jgi:hypothetical protein
MSFKVIFEGLFSLRKLKVPRIEGDPPDGEEALFKKGSSNFLMKS